MAHEQGNKPGDDPSKYGLKFDSEKPRWELIPKLELMKIVEVFNPLLPNGKACGYDFDITKFNRENLINDIFQLIFSYGMGDKSSQLGPRHSLLTIIAFKIFFLLRNKPYSKEELERSNTGLRWDLLNMKDIECVVNVYTMGARKYADHNWKRVSANRYYDALIRHFSTVRTPDRYDSELGCLHLHQAIWNVISLMWLESRIPDEILSAAKKLKGTSPIIVKPLKEKTAKKKAAKKKVTKKKS